MILVIDNYDSFTWNLVQYLSELDEVVTVRNDRITLQEIETMDPGHIVISPGPGAPSESGISKDVIRTFKGCIPILGVCLGHQAIGEVFGAEVVRAAEPFHGKVSVIHHEGRGLMKGLPEPFRGTRYHSLVVKSPLPEELKVTAHTEDGTVMAMEHREYPLFGVQFHPESILTESGMDLLKNFHRQRIV
ncbi:MAG: aminodeoxychorismate/anthranilate synthase component II [Thermovirgaceae bacterium]|nr:aminodeoxychorismate/anthranilate synthase component II [Thermovirgaceae bacterium]